MSSAISCPQCGRLLDNNDKFCETCGTAVSSIRIRATPSIEVAANAAEPTPGDARASRSARQRQALLDRVANATAGRFEIRGELGRGGMAVVFLAHDLRLDRKVALKVMLPGLAMSEEMIERFELEAKNAARLEHEHIVTIYSVEEIDDLNFFVMKLIDGASLGELVKVHGPLPVDVVRHVLAQVANALDYAHTQSVVHRDVKPGNVMIDARGNAIVTDFGISKGAGATDLTQTGSLVGTPAYMSPEQWRGLRAGPASDQYALGVMAYELLTGTPPFVGATMELRERHVASPPPSLRTLRPDCPDDFAKAVERMLAKHPEERWPSMREAGRALGLAPADREGVREIAQSLSSTATKASRPPIDSTPISPTVRRDSVPRVPRADSRVERLVVSHPSVSLVEGEELTLSARSVDTAGKAATAAPHWAASDVRIATVSASGVLRAVAPGDLEVTATVDGVTTTVKVHVAPVEAPVAASPVPPGALPSSPAARPSSPTADPIAAAPMSATVLGPQLERSVRVSARSPVPPPELGPAPAASRSSLPVPRAGANTVRAASTGATIDVRRNGTSTQPAWWRRQVLLGGTAIVAAAIGIWVFVPSHAARRSPPPPPADSTPPYVSTPAAIHLALSAAVLHVGDSSTVAAWSVPAGGKDSARVDGVLWRTSDSVLATVVGNGLINARAPGLVYVVAEHASVRDSIALEVQSDSAKTRMARVRIASGPNRAMLIGEGLRLRLDVRDSAGARLPAADASWQSTSPAVASVDPRGQLTANASGSALIKATVGEKTAELRIDVVAPQLQVLEITGAPSRLRVNETAQLGVTGRDQRGRPVRAGALHWSSSSDRVATIDPTTGSVRGRSNGSTTITVQSASLSASAPIEVSNAASPVVATAASTSSPTLPSPSYSSTPPAAGPNVEFRLRSELSRCAEAIKGRDIARLRTLYAEHSTRTDTDNLGQLAALFTGGKSAFEVLNQDLSRASRIAGEKASIDFRLRLKWRRPNGDISQDWREWRAEFALSGGAWNVRSCVLVGEAVLNR